MYVGTRLMSSLFLAGTFSFSWSGCSSLFQGLGNALSCIGFISRLSDLPDCYVDSEI